jgi:hypothetical protein
VDKRHLDVSFSIEIGVFGYFCKLKKPKLTMRSLYLLLCLLVVSQLSFGQTIQSSGAGSGDWNDPLSWTPNTVPNAANSTSIIISHSITVTATANGDQMTISSGGSLTINSGITFTANAGNGDDIVVSAGGTLTILSTGTLQLQSLPIPPPPKLALLRVFGTVNNSGTISNASSATLVFESNSFYNHQYTTSPGVIPTASWNLTSTCSILGYTTNSATPTGLNQAFGNFIWDTPLLSSFIDLNGALVTVNGNLLFQNIPSSYVYLTSATDYSLVVGGNFTINNSFFGFNSSATTSINVAGNVLFSNNGDLNPTFDGNVTLNCTGNFEISGGTTNLTYGGAGNIPINVGGNFTLSSSPVINNGGAGMYLLTFNGSGTQTYSASQEMTGYSYLILNGSRVDVPNGSFFSGGGSFTLQGGGTLGVAGANGLATGSSLGIVRVSGARNYAANGNIIYNGITQNLGNEWSASGALNGVAVNLEITNGTVVTNSNIGSTSLVGILSLTNGTINIGNSNTLTIQGVFNSTSSGSFGGSSTSNLSFSGSGTMGNLNFASGLESLNNLTVGRTGTLVLGSNLTIEGAINLSFGNLDFSGRTLTINGSSISSSGTGLVSSSASNLIFGGSTFSGSVPFQGAGNQLNNLTFSTPGGIFTWNSPITINNNINLIAGTINHSSGLTMGTNSTFVRSGGSLNTTDLDVVTSYNVTYTGSVTTGLELPSSATELNNLTINSSGSVSLDKDIIVNGNVNLLGSTLVAGTRNITLAGSTGNWIRTSGTFSGGTGVVTVAGNYAIIATGVTPNFTNLAVNSTRSLTLPSGNINIGGNLVNNGTIIPGTSTAIFNGSTTISGSSTTSLNNVTVSNSLTAPSATILNIAGNFANNGTFLHNNGSINFTSNTTISGSSSTSLYNTTISGIFTAPSGTLNIAGNLTNSGGTFNNNNGTLLFNGTVAAQSITGAFVFNNVNVSNPSKVNNNGNIDLNGTLSLVSAGQFDADGAGAGIFVIKSSSVTTGGRIAALTTPANFSGTVTVERFINGPDSWRYLSMPITNGNAGTWQANFPVTGNFSNPSPNGVNGVVSSTAASITLWNAATQAYVNVGSGGTTASTSLSNLVGYSAYTYLPGDFTISATGIARTGNATIPVSTGFNLVPNPYPSPVDWDNMNRTGFTSTVYIRVANNVFASYVAGGVVTNAPFGGWTGEIATGQSFWIESTGATALNLTETSKSGNQYQFLREGEPANLIRIALSSDSQRDETIIWFPEGASSDFDNSFDASKMRNGYYSSEDEKGQYINIATVSGTKEYAINGLGKISCDNSTKLLVADVKPGSHTLTFQGLESMDLGYRVVLVDRYEKIEKNIVEGTEYEFLVNEDVNSFGADRFEIRFILDGNAWINSQTPPLAEIINPCAKDMITLSIKSQQGASYQLLMNGSPISDDVIGRDQTSLNFDISRQVFRIGQNSIDLIVKSLNGCGQFTFANVASFDNQNIIPPVITRDGFMLLSNASSGNEWMLDGVKIEGNVGQTLSITKSGVYSVLISNGACSLASNELLVEFDDHKIQTYPNPSADRVFITLPSEINNQVSSITLLDSRGVKILDNVSNPEILLGEVKVLDLTSVEPGLYILNILADKRHVIKIIKK